MKNRLAYLTGFGNEHASEALPGALPVGRNSPQRPPFGLYAELMSGTAFTAPRAINRRAWFYRIRPSVTTLSPMRALEARFACTAPDSGGSVPVLPLRWNPLPMPEAATDFVDGWHTMATAGAARQQQGLAAHIYVCNRSMEHRYFQNLDGELLIVPQEGRLRVRTEAGVLEAGAGEICVIPRGYKFAVDLDGNAARGYLCENYGAHLRLPELGPLGSNGLANPRDFEYPVAAFEEHERRCELVTKADGRLFACDIDASPLDVVAWHGTCAPFRYDLARFNAIGSISFDHPDPSIFTVLTSPSDSAGVANVDFVIFPPRWLVAEDTFRPPWYHRNVMSEFMGLIRGVYDAKPDGFVPGGSSLHNAMVPHGPDRDALERASASRLQPEKLSGTMAFMFESRFALATTEFAMQGGALQADYPECWQGIPRRFQPDPSA